MVEETLEAACFLLRERSSKIGKREGTFDAGLRKLQVMRFAEFVSTQKKKPNPMTKNGKGGGPRLVRRRQ